MVALSVQTLLLMGAAYFIGAALACLIRRSLFAPAAYSTAERRVDPLPEIAQRDAGATRFASPSSPLPPPQPAAPPFVPPPATDGVQDLKRIRLIDAGIETSLNKLGVTRYEHIAGWMRDDVKKVSQALGIKGRINQENWIEQALILAKGGETHYSARRARGEAATAAPTSDEGERGIECALPRPMSRAGVAAAVVAPPLAETKPAPAVAAPAPSPPLVSERAAFAGGTAGRQAASRLGCRRRSTGRACAPGGARARQSAAHRHHHARDRKGPECAGRLALRADRAMVASPI